MVVLQGILILKNAFTNAQIEPAVYVEPERYVHNEEVRSNVVITLQNRLYRLKFASKTWLGLIAKKCAEAGLKQLHSTTCVFSGGGFVLVYYVGDLSKFEKTAYDVLKL